MAVAGVKSVAIDRVIQLAAVWAQWALRPEVASGLDIGAFLRKSGRRDGRSAIACWREAACRVRSRT